MNDERDSPRNDRRNRGCYRLGARELVALKRGFRRQRKTARCQADLVGILPLVAAVTKTLVDRGVTCGTMHGNMGDG